MDGSGFRKSRAKVLDDSEGKCAKCGRPGTHNGKSWTGIEVHHINPRYLGGSDSHANLVPLCHVCHEEWDVFESIGFPFNRWLALPPVALLVSALESDAGDGMTVAEFKNMVWKMHAMRKSDAMWWREGEAP